MDIIESFYLFVPGSIPGGTTKIELSFELKRIYMKNKSSNGST
jgi:hypothetical protein